MRWKQKNIRIVKEKENKKLYEIFLLRYVNNIWTVVAYFSWKWRKLKVRAKLRNTNVSPYYTFTETASKL